MQQKWVYAVFTVGAVCVALISVAAAPGRAHVRNVWATSGPPPGLTVYGQTLWNIEALMHDTYGSRTTCLRLRDDASVSTTCGDLAEYGYWQHIFPHARHSRFRLVHLASAPAMGNVRLVTLKGRYVSCGRFPGWGALAHEGSRTRRWLVVVHGWAMTPFMCLGQ
jgi:hypothetical protein